ncbi:aspartate--tRNA(Asn) ligase [candidate division WWE3 bacterium CG08_land_8_20_14_0_20_40_13]|uniref:Aspartate--tRNA ligase n=1 Tax=candidate division WWE3 bacterium CG08_land_8_20_14_0_20_40_13 TaxID=1975084 RepID=A0A2H0XE53_UNCKA|nr:MAG: aspartate--tRNA(Asn) ligase [candidate division WWE3 bacterium CG08_land_8_20_14_0_20_40_13]
MERTYISQTVDKIGQLVRLKGYINTVRDHGKITFIDLRDKTGVLQCVGTDLKIQLRGEDVVEIEGAVKSRPEKMVNEKLPTGKVELAIVKLTVIEKADELPFDLGGNDLNVSLPVLLDYRSLTLRHPKSQAIFKVQNQVVKTFRDYLSSQGFVEFNAPTIVPVATEGGANVFPIKYFEHDCYLAQSPQLYKQIMVGVFERVFSVARAYRAEPSVTTRHICEYVSLDAEMGFIDSWTEVMDVLENLFKKVFADIDLNCKDELALFDQTVPRVENLIPRIKMREAQQIIFERTGVDHRAEKDLEPEDEREICRWAAETKGSELVFVTHYPTAKRAFYTMPDPADPEFSLSFDLLGRGLEWVSGSQRINNHKELVKAVELRGNNVKDFELYLQAFKYGMPPEGGFALGAERITMQILGLENIREATLFPRDMERVDIKLSSLKTQKNAKKIPLKKTP